MFISLVHWRNRKNFLNLIVKFLGDEISVFYFAENFRDILFDEEAQEAMVTFMEKEVFSFPEETETIKIIYFRIMLDRIERTIIDLLDIFSNDIELNSSLSLTTIYPEIVDAQLPFPLSKRIEEFRKELIKIFFRSQIIKDGLLDI